MVAVMMIPGDQLFGNQWEKLFEIVRIGCHIRGRISTGHVVEIIQSELASLDLTKVVLDNPNGVITNECFTT